MPSIHRDGLRTIANVAEAEAWYNRLPVWRGRQETLSGWAYADADKTAAPRCIGKGVKQKPHMTLRPRSNGSWACRLYDTDVVIYNPDGSIDLDVTYGSVSTSIFANALLPSGVDASSTSGVVALNGAGWWDRDVPNMRVYNADSPVTIEREGEIWVCNNASPFQSYYVDRAQAKLALAVYPIGQFEKWFKAYSAMNGWDMPTHKRRGGFGAKHHIRFNGDDVDMLKDLAKWPALADHLRGAWLRLSAWDRPAWSTEFQRFREALYRHEHVYAFDDLLYATSYPQVERIKRMRSIARGY